MKGGVRRVATMVSPGPALRPEVQPGGRGILGIAPGTRAEQRRVRVALDDQRDLRRLEGIDEVDAAVKADGDAGDVLGAALGADHRARAILLVEHDEDEDRDDAYEQTGDGDAAGSVQPPRFAPAYTEPAIAAAARNTPTMSSVGESK